MRVALLLYPLLELWSLIELGAATSAGLAVLWVLGAGFVGMATIRFAGAQVVSRLQAAQQQGMLQQQLVKSIPDPQQFCQDSGLLPSCNDLRSQLLQFINNIPHLGDWH